MKLNGWLRIGIVASVVWAVVGYLYTFQDVYGSSQGLYDTIEQHCLQRATDSGDPQATGKCEDDFTQSLHQSFVAAREAGIFAALIPIPLAWGGIYFVLFLVRWVRRGFPGPSTPPDIGSDPPPQVNRRFSRMQILVGSSAAVLLVWLIYSYVESNHMIAEDRQTIADLTARQKASDDKPSFELQSRCGEAAKQYFKREWENAAPGMDKDYTSHYNPDLRRCFITVKTSEMQKNGTVFTTKGVFDAVEGKTYGEYVWQSDTVKKYWEVPPMQCNGLTLDGDEVRCRSDGEFENLMSKFMDVSDN